MPSIRLPKIDITTDFNSITKFVVNNLAFANVYFVLSSPEGFQYLMYSK